MTQTTSSYQLKDINPWCFWDMDLGKLDYDNNVPLIIQRVLEYGELSDWYAIKRHYGLEKVIEFAKQFEHLNPMIVSFLCTISGEKKELFLSEQVREQFGMVWKRPQDLFFEEMNK